MNPGLEALKEVYRDREAAAHAWKREGGRIVGYVGEGVPEALISAFGFLPYRLSGNSKADLSSLDRYLYPLFSKAQSTRGFLDSDRDKTVLAQLFDGTLDFLDYLVVPYGRKSESLFVTHLATARAADDALPLPEMHLIDRATTPSYAGSLFDKTQIVEFSSVLAKWSGQALDEAALAKAIEAFNLRVARLQDVLALRHAREPRLSGADALAIIGSGWLMPTPAYISNLDAILRQSDELPVRQGPRLFVGGSALDYPAVYAGIERSGATIVGDGHSWGEAVIQEPIATDLAPIDAIAEAFHRAPRAFCYPLADAVKRITHLADAASAEAAVFFVHRADLVTMFDIPDMIAALAEAGIPSLHLQEQPYLGAQFAALADQLDTFLKSSTSRQLRN